MIDVSGGYLGNPAVETAGFKMIDVNRASILNTKFRTARKNYVQLCGYVFKKNRYRILTENKKTFFKAFSFELGDSCEKKTRYSLTVAPLFAISFKEKVMGLNVPCPIAVAKRDPSVFSTKSIVLHV